MSKRTKGSLRSSRGGFFTEPERRSSEKRRSQRVRFRRAYASSVMKRSGVRFLKLAGGAIVVGGLIYGGTSALRFWQMSSSLRVSAVQFDGDIPPTLGASLPIKSGQHLFQLELKKIEQDLKTKFPELQTLTVERRLNRSVTVTGRYKKAEAFYEADGQKMGVFVDGTLFPIVEHNTPPDELVILSGKTTAAVKSQQIKALKIWKKGAPKFWTLVKRVETDNIGAVRVTLEGGIVVQWGEMNEPELLTHAENILSVLDRFTPIRHGGQVRSPALLRVLSTNRIVMDSNWKQK